jgi:methylenetetrahydrofolate dehydrogenase (NADP+)/methenyltetrahydrofolate cyclohydrolase
MIIDGKKIAADILADVKKQVSELSFQPVFCDILVGDDPASAQYVGMKARSAEKVGIKFRHAHYPSNITTEELVVEIKKIGQEPDIRGLIVQLPLPKSLNRDAVLNAIDPKIDVDCTGKVNTDLFYKGSAQIIFPTAVAVLATLESTKQNLKGKKILVLGQGILVGKPVSFLLKQKGYDVQTANDKTKNTNELLKQADVVISAVGKPKFITGDKIKTGAIVIDAGTSESEGGISGDVDFDSVKNIAGFISPVPGGVGPITVAKLMENVLIASKA